VTIKNLPVPNTGFAFTAEPVISSNSQLLHQPGSQNNGGNVAEEDIGEDVVPPAFTEMVKSMLGRQLYDFVENVPKMKDVRVSNDKGGKDPVHPMNKVVVVHVVPQVP